MFSKISPSFIHADSQSESVSQLAFYVNLKLTWPAFIFLTWTQLHHGKAPLIPRATGASVLVSVTCNDNVDVTEPCHALCHASGAQSLGQVICAI